MQQTNIIDLGKVGITVEKNVWNSSTFYERLTMVHHKESGNTYVSVEDNVNRDPSKDDGSNWILASSNGMSIYELMVARGKYSGTEEQFLADYAKAVADANAGAAAANLASTAALAAADEANEAKAQTAAATELCENATAACNTATSNAQTAANNANAVKIALDNFIEQGGGATDAQVIKNTGDIATLGSNVEEINKNFGKVVKNVVFSGAEYKQYPLLSYLGKTTCNITVSGVSPQKFSIRGKNKSTGSTIVLYDTNNSQFNPSAPNAVNLPITFSNPRPDLELIDLWIEQSATSTQGNVNVVIMSDGGIVKDIAELKQSVSVNQTAISNNTAAIDNNHRLLIPTISDSVVVGGANKSYSLVDYLGKKRCFVKISGTKPQSFTIVGKNKESGSTFKLCDFTSPTQINNGLVISNPHYEIELVEVGIIFYSTAQNDNVSISIFEESNNQQLREALFNIDNQEASYSKTFAMEPNWGDTLLSYLGKTACTFEITGSGQQQFRIQGKNKATGNPINICDFTTPVDLPVVIDNPRTDLELIDLNVYAYSKASVGDMTVKITKKSPFVEGDNSKKDGKYQFGRGLSLDCYLGEVDGIDGQQFNLLPFWYDRYDALVSAHPDYVSKINCDTEYLSAHTSDSRPTQLNDMPIYMYKFTPKYPYSNNASAPTKMNKIKVMVVTGTHPEYVAMWDMYQVMKAICEKWNTDANLRALRNNVEFYIMPVGNPWGVRNAVRTNYNGVDMNRNMPSSTWQLTPEGNTYSGPYAGSEYESRVLAYMIDKYNPLIFVDHHNFGTNKSGEFIYGVTHSQLLMDILCDAEMEVDGRLKAKFSELPQNTTDRLYSYVADAEGTGSRESYACDKDGMHGCCVETTYASYWNNGVLVDNPTHVRDSFVCTVATYTWLSTLLMLIEGVTTRVMPKK